MNFSSINLLTSLLRSPLFRSAKIFSNFLLIKYSFFRVKELKRHFVDSSMLNRWTNGESINLADSSWRVCSEGWRLFTRTFTFLDCFLLNLPSEKETTKNDLNWQIIKVFPKFCWWHSSHIRSSLRFGCGIGVFASIPCWLYWLWVCRFWQTRLVGEVSKIVNKGHCSP